MTRSRRVVWTLVAVAGALFLSLGALEAGLRLLGRGPWVPPRWPVEVRPDRPFFLPDPELGYRLAPGRFEVALREGRYTFEVTHLDDGTRDTGGGVTDAASGAVWVFGCSFTYGWSLDDGDTYPWLLRQRLAKPVVNFGVNGYGTLQSLLRFRQALREREPPAVAILGYSWLHDMRNVFARVYRKAIAAPMESVFGTYRFPYARLGNGGLRFHITEIGFDEPPLLRHSALVNVLERRWTTFELRSLQPETVTGLLIDAFAAEARAAGVRPLVAGLDRHPRSRTLEAAAERGIPTADVSVDLRDGSFRNDPWDPHPNARSHRRYADGIVAALESLEERVESQSGSDS